MYLCLITKASQRWSLLKTLTDDCDLPAGRYAHICTVSGPLMYIQGGTCLTRRYTIEYTAELLSFNLETHTWRQVHCDGLDLRELPVARDFHSGHYINGSIYIFGGKCTYTHSHTLILAHTHSHLHTHTHTHSHTHTHTHSHTHTHTHTHNRCMHFQVQHLVKMTMGFTSSI